MVKSNLFLLSMHLPEIICLLPFCRDCVGGTFQLPIGSVRQCSTQCANQTRCVLVQVPEEHLKVYKVA